MDYNNWQSSDSTRNILSENAVLMRNRPLIVSDLLLGIVKLKNFQPQQEMLLNQIRQAQFLTQLLEQPQIVLREFKA
jgi:hypothetical protein